MAGQTKQRTRQTPKQRLQTTIDELNEAWNQLQNRLKALREKYNVEARKEEKIRMQEVIEENETDLKAIEKKLRQAENKLQKEKEKASATKPHQSRKKPQSNLSAPSDQNEVVLRVREEITKLFNDPRCRSLQETLVRNQPARDRQTKPEDLLIPKDLSELDKSIRTLHTTSSQCLEYLKEHNPGIVVNIVDSAINLLGWLILLSIRADWLENDAGRLKRLLSSGYIEIPLRSKASSEVIIARFRSHAAKFTLEDGDIVDAPGNIKLNDLERGLWHKDHLTEIKREIWKTIFKRDPEPFEDYEEELKHVLEFRNEEGEHYHITIQFQNDSSSPDNSKLLNQLSKDLPHLAVFLIGADNDEQILVMKEARFHALIREFLIMLRKYQ